MAKPGDRVGAVICADKETETVEFAGYGIYKGDEIPPAGVEFLGNDLNVLGHTNPRIDLDNGKTVWGCQVWWGPEQTIKGQLSQYEKAGYAIIETDLDKRD